MKKPHLRWYGVIDSESVFKLDIVSCVCGPFYSGLEDSAQLLCNAG